jgi:hypothetical protein
MEAAPVSATPYIPSPRDTARRLILRRWLGTALELAALALFVAMVLHWAAIGASIGSGR